MRACVLIRKHTSDDGTFGVMLTDKSGKRWYTGELPWRNNEREISCIPAGEYEARWDKSPHFGECYHLVGVPNRSEVLIHVGNWCGDKQLGKKSDVHGCIILGKGKAMLMNQPAVTDSKAAIAEFHAEMKQEPFKLYVYDVGQSNEFQVDAGVA